MLLLYLIAILYKLYINVHKRYKLDSIGLEIILNTDRDTDTVIRNTDKNTYTDIKKPRSMKMKIKISEKLNFRFDFFASSPVVFSFFFLSLFLF